MPLHCFLLDFFGGGAIGCDPESVAGVVVRSTPALLALLDEVADDRPGVDDGGGGGVDAGALAPERVRAAKLVGTLAFQGVVDDEPLLFNSGCVAALNAAAWRCQDSGSRGCLKPWRMYALSAAVHTCCARFQGTSMFALL